MPASPFCLKPFLSGKLIKEDTAPHNRYGDTLQNYLCSINYYTTVVPLIVFILPQPFNSDRQHRRLETSLVPGRD